MSLKLRERSGLERDVISVEVEREVVGTAELSKKEKRASDRALGCRCLEVWRWLGRR